MRSFSVVLLIATFASLRDDGGGCANGNVATEVTWFQKYTSAINVWYTDKIADSILALQQRLPAERIDERERVCVRLPTWKTCSGYVNVCITYPYTALHYGSSYCKTRVTGLSRLIVTDHLVLNDSLVFFPFDVYARNTYQDDHHYQTAMDLLAECGVHERGADSEPICGRFADDNTTTARFSALRHRVRNGATLSNDSRIDAILHAMRLVTELQVRNVESSQVIYVRLCHRKPTLVFSFSSSLCCDIEAYEVEMTQYQCVDSRTYHWQLDECVRTIEPCRYCYDGTLEKIHVVDEPESNEIHRRNPSTMCAQPFDECERRPRYIRYRNDSRHYEVCVGSNLVQRGDCGPGGEFDSYTSRCKRPELLCEFARDPNDVYGSG